MANGQGADRSAGSRSRRTCDNFNQLVDYGYNST